MKPAVLLLHGWPQPIKQDDNSYRYFRSRGYKIIAPRLFTSTFRFNQENIVKYLKSELRGIKPDVIVGISLGGIILPWIASDYPEAKIIFIASGYSLQPKYFPVKLAFNLAKHKGPIRMLANALNLPQPFLVRIYQYFNPYNPYQDSWEEYVGDMKFNFAAIKSISPTKHLEVIRYAASLDNHKILSAIKNKALIFCSPHDSLMPGAQSHELHQLLKGSRLIETPRSHFSVFTKVNFPDLDLFLQ